MRSRWLEVAVFVVVLAGLFVWAGEVVTRASGSTRRVAVGEGVSVANGEGLFWDRGKCHTCHAVGPRGRSVRGPNLGASADGPDMAVRAAGRAEERSAALGRTVSAADYLVESLVDPGAHLVAGFKDEMPRIHEPPINLGPDELVSVVLYLQSVGGEPDPAAVALPPEVRSGRADRPVAAWAPYLDGDAARGRGLFFDPAGPAACGTCHRVGEEGGGAGPELTNLAGTRTPEFILESLLEPSAAIANGYETELLELATGRLVEGVVGRETSDSLWLTTSTGEEMGVAVPAIRRRRTQETSLMPENLADLLTVRDLHDLLAYLRTLQ